MNRRGFFQFIGGCIAGILAKPVFAEKQEYGFSVGKVYPFVTCDNCQSKINIRDERPPNGCVHCSTELITNGDFGCSNWTFGKGWDYLPTTEGKRFVSINEMPIGYYKTIDQKELNKGL